MYNQSILFLDTSYMRGLLRELLRELFFLRKKGLAWRGSSGERSRLAWRGGAGLGWA